MKIQNQYNSWVGAHIKDKFDNKLWSGFVERDLPKRGQIWVQLNGQLWERFRSPYWYQVINQLWDRLSEDTKSV